MWTTVTSIKVVVEKDQGCPRLSNPWQGTKHYRNTLKYLTTWVLVDLFPLCFGGIFFGAGGLPLCVGNKAFFGSFLLCINLSPGTPLPKVGIVILFGVLLTWITRKLKSLEGFCEDIKSPYNATNISFFVTSNMHEKWTPVHFTKCYNHEYPVATKEENWCIRSRM